MKKTILLILSVVSIGIFAQDLKLPAPRRTGGATLREALERRCASRTFTGKAISEQQISDLLYAACGINRKDKGKLTIPTARNVQDITVYAATEQGIYRYDSAENSLKLVRKGDFRSQMGMQKAMFAKSALALFYVSDLAKYDFGTQEERLVYAASHAGYATQNVSLVCAAEGLGNVVIGSYRKDKAPELLGLGKGARIMMAHLVGVVK